MRRRTRSDSSPPLHPERAHPARPPHRIPSPRPAQPRHLRPVHTARRFRPVYNSPHHDRAPGTDECPEPLPEPPAQSNPPEPARPRPAAAAEPARLRVVGGGRRRAGHARPVFALDTVKVISLTEFDTCPSRGDQEAGVRREDAGAGRGAGPAGGRGEAAQPDRRAVRRQPAAAERHQPGADEGGERRQGGAGQAEGGRPERRHPAGRVSGRRRAAAVRRPAAAHGPAVRRVHRLLPVRAVAATARSQRRRVRQRLHPQPGPQVREGEPAGRITSTTWPAWRG